MASKNGDVHGFVKGQITEAQKRLAALEAEAGKVVKHLIARGQESRRELDGFVEKLGAGEFAKRAGEATQEARKKAQEFQNRLVEAAGVASQHQVRALNRELTKLSKKVDGLATRKGPKSDARA